LVGVGWVGGVSWGGGGVVVVAIFNTCESAFKKNILLKITPFFNKKN